MNLSKHVKIHLVQNGLADGDTDPDSDSVDMSAFDGVVFVGIIGVQAAGATASLQAEQSEDDSTFNALVGAVVTSPINSDDKFLVLDVYRPLKRFLRTALTRGGTGNTTYGGTIAIQYMASKKPTNHEALKLAAEALAVSPDEV